jgi:hypothetical protein
MRDFNCQQAMRLFLCGLVVVLIGVVLVMSWVPPISRDALTHHLAVPKLYVKHGGMVEIPSLVFSYYPMNLDLLYIPPLLLNNDIIPKYIHFIFALLTAGLIFVYLRRRVGRVYALAGILFFLSLPVIVKLSTTVYVDLGLVFFSTLALIYLLKWIEVLLMSLFVPFVYTKKKRTLDDPDRPGLGFLNLRTTLKALGYGAVYVLVALTIFSPWAVRNYVWTQNPVYPLFDRYFQDQDMGRPSQATPEAPDTLGTASVGPSIISSPFATRRVLFGETWWQTLLIPVRIFFEGRDDRPRQFDGRLNPYLLLLPMFAFFLKRNENKRIRSEKNILLTFSVLFIVFAFFKADMRMRYITPAIPALVILSILGLRNILNLIDGSVTGSFRALGKSIVVVIVGGLLGLNAVYVGQLYQRIDPMSYIGGTLTRDQYIERYRPEYAAIRYANQTLAQDARIFGLFLGNRSYYSDREVVFGDSFFYHTVVREDSARDIAGALKQKKITHVLVYYRILKRWSTQNFNLQERVKLVDFFNNHASLVFAKGEYGLYQL